MVHLSLRAASIKKFWIYASIGVFLNVYPQKSAFTGSCFLISQSFAALQSCIVMYASDYEA
jgi:hypothetical protein